MAYQSQVRPMRKVTVLPIEKRRTRAHMTKFEYARVISSRAVQLQDGADILVNLDGETDAVEIAEKEMRQGKIPLLVERPFPDGSVDIWPVWEMIPPRDLMRDRDGNSLRDVFPPNYV
jgi:DNA-directed RNA polymerases I, II, and III subunit RPABC2